jgi:uncharacterized protein (TIGR02001 family)
MLRFILVPAAIAATMAAVPAAAQEAAKVEPALKVTGGVTIASQYRFRGVSLSDEEAALQGTINLNHESGLYAGVYGYSLDGFGELGGSNLELDLYAGYRREVAKGVTVDAGLLYYAFPRSTGGDFEFFEPYANLSGAIGPITAKVGLAYAWEQDGLGGDDNLYLFNDNSFAVPNTPIALISHVGYSTGGSALALSGNYLDWSLGASATWRNLTLGLAYADTDVGAAQALAAGATKDIVDSAIVATLTASF